MIKIKGIQSGDRSLNMSEAVQAWVDLIPIAHNLDGLSSQNLELDIYVHMSLSAALDLLLHVPELPRNYLLQWKTEVFIGLLERLLNVYYCGLSKIIYSLHQLQW